MARAGSEEVRSFSISALEVGARGELRELLWSKKELSECESMWVNWDGMGWVRACGCSGHLSPWSRRLLDSQEGAFGVGKG